MKRTVLLLAITTMTAMVAGCQSALHQYDGVLGYSSAAMPDGRFLISYTDEKRASWDDMEKGVNAICAHTLNITRESATLLNVKKEIFSQTVDMAFMTAPGKQENGTRELQLKRVTAECVRNTKVERETLPQPKQMQSQLSSQPRKNQNDACTWIGGPSPQDKLGCKVFHENEQSPTNSPGSSPK